MDEEVLDGYRRVTYLGIPVILSFGVLDFASVDIPSFVRLFIGMRVALVAILAILYKVAKTWRGALYPAATFATYLAGSTIALMSALYGGHTSFYYAGINVVIVWIGLLVPFGPLPMAACCLAILCTYIGLTIGLDPAPFAEWDWGIFLSNTVFIAATGIVVTIGAYVKRVLRRVAFDATTEQERANHELRLANEKIRQNYAELADKQNELEEAYRYKSQFLDNMSHELRTPLTCILTPLEGLLDSDAPLEQKQVFEDMYRASRQLYDLINDLLDYSRYGAREIPLRRAPVDLVRLVDDNVRAWAPTSRQRGIELAWRGPAERGDQRIIAMVDGRELGKVIRNLLSNAVKFTPAAGTVRVDLSIDGGDLVLAVADSGIGMDEEALSQIFRPFFQVDGSSTRAFQGTGLGLALVKTIVTRHEGTIAVQSAPGQGTTMTVRIPYLEVHDTEAVAIALPDSPFSRPLPAASPGLKAPSIEAPLPAAEAPAPAPAEAPVAAVAEAPTEVATGAEASAPPPAAEGVQAPIHEPPRLVLVGEPGPPVADVIPLPSALPTMREHRDASERTRMKILVVDDHPEILRLIARILGRDYDVVTAADGEEGLQRVREVEPDLVISDVMMPKLSGFEMVDILRRDPLTERVPVLLLTARADGSDKVKGLRRANDYLVKPFVPDELRARVSNLLRMRQNESYLTRLNEELETSRDSLEGRLHDLFFDTVRTLVAAIDAKDFYTGGHSERVSYFSVRLAEQMKLPRPSLRTIELGALLHDVGKIGIPDRVLNKPGRLSDDEIEIIRQHTVFGGQILEKSPELAELRRFALHHHERWDGRGYPDGLHGEEIPLSVRVVSVADCWDAMISDRVYRPGMEPRIAAEKIAKLRGNQFDPQVVEALMGVWSDMELPSHLRPLKARSAPTEVRAGPRVSECGEVYHVHES